MITSVTIHRHGDGFLKVLADGEEVARALTLDQAVTWAANLLLEDEGAHVTVERYPRGCKYENPTARGGHTMSIKTVSIEGSLFTNELAPIDTAGDPIEGADGLAEVERTDDNEVTLHLRHYADEQACISLSMTRADALALAEVLRAVVAEG